MIYIGNVESDTLSVLCFGFHFQAGFKASPRRLSASAVRQAALGDSASGSRDAGARREEPAGRGPASQPHPIHQKPQTAGVLPTRYFCSELLPQTGSRLAALSDYGMSSSSDLHFIILTCSL